MIGESIIGDLLGIIIGHIYYFFSEIYPKWEMSEDVRIFRTPLFMYLYIHIF